MKKNRNELLLHSVKQGSQENMSAGTIPAQCARK
jgi:hypothetical protein